MNHALGALACLALVAIGGVLGFALALVLGSDPVELEPSWRGSREYPHNP